MGLRSMHHYLVVKVDSVYEDFTVKELKKFQYRLSRILVTPQSVLCLYQVEEGCLQLIFQVPLIVQQEIFPLSSEQEQTRTEFCLKTMKKNLTSIHNVEWMNVHLSMGQRATWIIQRVTEA